MSDLIERGDTIKALYKYSFVSKDIIEREINAIPSADRPRGEVDAIDRDALIDYCLKLIDVERKQGSDVMNYGQERVNQTEAIIDYIEYMPHVNADRPQGHWTKTDVATYRCSECGKIQIADDVNELNYCCCCGSRNKVRRLKGADNETDNI